MTTDTQHLGSPDLPGSPGPDSRPCGYPEGVALPGLATSRRGLLRGAALGGLSLSVGGAVVSQAPIAAAAETSAIVVVSLRGGSDGLSMVVPHGDQAYYDARPNTGVAADRLLMKDAMFGFHPSMSALQGLWDAGSLAAVHAAGLPVANRSHFSAMEEIEDADPGSAARVGWLNRLLGTDALTSPLQGLSVGGRPLAMVGPEPTMTVGDVNGVKVSGASSLSNSDPRFGSLRQAWKGSVPGRAAMRDGMSAALTAASDFQAVKDVSTTATFPNSSLGRALAIVSRTVRADVGSSVFTVDSGNWDMHTDIGSSSSGWMVNNARDLAASIAAFFTDLGDAASRVTLVTISEFGRRVAENANRGFDHGWGNVMLVAGAGVRGGQYHGSWPGLATGVNADLSVTTDYRSVLAEVVAARTAASTATVFPGFRRESVGVMTGQ
ncbi:DUF1501 domain-containing protein [Nocardioides bruguierae]|uniref:DUF1501 domain-containing protein n=1 Tax=Nocardioides bruguierae TaxID=2945102 RepID=A0A9X2D6Y2_9ACTN|nr:DUF1501 domain-containing protein [Nocardioides bruguierae]MCM0620488.1 DUF1501 domain-containing protein [Nocardioides bruguierae]